MRLAEARRLASVKEGEFMGRYDVTSTIDEDAEMSDFDEDAMQEGGESRKKKTSNSRK